MIEEISDEQFDDIITTSDTVIVDFYGDNCGPCKALEPILNEVSELIQNDIKIVKIRADQDSAKTMEYGIRGVPTLLKFSNGKLSATKVGASSKMDIIKFINQ